MAGKPKGMSQIKQLLQLHQQGKGIKSIARSLGISKNTVKALSHRARAYMFSKHCILLLNQRHNTIGYSDKQFDGSPCTHLVANQKITSWP